MDLFLLVTIRKDRLYLPAALTRKLKEKQPGVHFFHADNHASPELIHTASEAVRRAQSLVIYVDSESAEDSPGPLGALMKTVVQHTGSRLWIELGDHPFNVFRNLFRGRVSRVYDQAGIWELLDDFYN